MRTISRIVTRKIIYDRFVEQMEPLCDGAMAKDAACV